VISCFSSIRRNFQIKLRSKFGEFNISLILLLLLFAHSLSLTSKVTQGHFKVIDRVEISSCSLSDMQVPSCLVSSHASVEPTQLTASGAIELFDDVAETDTIRVGGEDASAKYQLVAPQLSLPLRWVSSFLTAHQHIIGHSVPCHERMDSESSKWVTIKSKIKSDDN